MLPPDYQAYGLTTDQLSEAQSWFTRYARLRIENLGRKQYEKADHQRFEELSPVEILVEMRDEIADAVNYLAFLDIQISRWINKVREIEA